jgi:hypothetical protein
MLSDLTISNPLSPIKRLTPADRLAAFDKESNSIYKKYSVYTQSTGPGIKIGSSQPYVFIDVSSSNLSKNITRADSQAMPFGSTLLDIKRVSKFATSGTGLLYIGKQYLLQKQNSFNETRIYNPFSLLSATAAKGSTGLIDRPVRFLPVSGGVGNFIATSLLSVVGIQSKAIENNPDGTATGAALSGYAKMNGLPAKGLIRYESGDSGRNRFNTFFPDAGTDQVDQKTPSLGSALGKALISKLKSFIPSTNPFGFGGGADNKWEIRPEYKGRVGAYESMYADKGGMLAINNTPKPNSNSPGGFLDTIKSSLSAAFLGAPAKAPQGVAGDAIKVDEFHRYTPTLRYSVLSAGDRANSENARIRNFNITKQYGIIQSVGVTTDTWDKTVQYRKSTEQLKTVEDYKNSSNTPKKYITYPQIAADGNVYGKLPFASALENDQLTKLKSPVESWDPKRSDPRSRPSIERLSTVGDYSNNTNNPKSYTTYAEIGTEQKKYSSDKLKTDDADGSINKTQVSKLEKVVAGYSAIGKTKFTNTISEKITISKRGFASYKEEGNTNSVADKINVLEVISKADRNTIPTSLTFGNSQSTDLIFFHFFDLVNNTYIPFRATLTSINEVHSPEWDPIQYLGRADKLYMYKGFERTLNFNFTVYANSLEELVPMWSRINYLVGLTRPPKYTDKGSADPSGALSKFMYPPMITLTMGDLYEDQPAVITSVGISIPDDSLWETFRGNGAEYNEYIGKDYYDENTKSLQLPTKVDVNVGMNLMEKSRSITNGDHYNVTAAF